MSSTPRTRLPGARTATGIALAATMLTTAGVAAQSPAATTAPSATTAPTQSTDRPSRGGQHGMGFGSDHGQRGFGGGQRGFDGSRGSQGPGATRGSVTVSSIDGANLALETADGWSRTIDTTGVVLTRDDATIAITDILVGERVRVVQTQNADGTYTVTGIEVQPSTASGTVGTASADGFTVVGSDGTTTTVTVNDQTTWSTRGSSTAPTLADATAGRSVAVSGVLQADGSIVATKVRLG